MPCNKADAVRSARLNGKKMAIKIKVKTNKAFQFLFLSRTCISLKSKQKNDYRHFFMNRSGQDYLMSVMQERKENG
jgi:hypothetical protein